jgi:hypothetical protein
MRIASSGEYALLAVDLPARRAVLLPVQASALHLHAHRARGAGDYLHRRLDVARVQVGHLRLGDLAHLLLAEAADLVLFGSDEPFSRFSASLISTAAGGVFVMKVNERSS